MAYWSRDVTSRQDKYFQSNLNEDRYYEIPLFWFHSLENRENNLQNSQSGLRIALEYNHLPVRNLIDKFLFTHIYYS